MNKTRLTLLAALLGLASGIALGADTGAAEARQQRMDKALEDSRNPHPGRSARAENSVKRGAHKAGAAVGKGVRKTGEAIGRGGKKLENASTPKP
jgi:hypothetical protein